MRQSLIVFAEPHSHSFDNATSVGVQQVPYKAVAAGRIVRSAPLVELFMANQLR
jgi:hypothetical protein